MGPYCKLCQDIVYPTAQCCIFLYEFQIVSFTPIIHLYSMNHHDKLWLILEVASFIFSSSCNMSFIMNDSFRLTRTICLSVSFSCQKSVYDVYPRRTVIH